MNFPPVSDNFDWPSFANAVLVADQLTTDFRERLHLEWTVRGHRIRQSLANDERLIAFLRCGLPTYCGGKQILYRGENLDRWNEGAVGFCWTAIEATARMFGSGLNAVSMGGVLLRTTASVEAIIAGPSAHSLYLGESEFTLEPALLREISVIEQYNPV